MPAHSGRFSRFHMVLFPANPAMQILLMAGLAAVCGAASAADVHWVGPANGPWTNPANWSGGMVPVAADNVSIGGGAAVSVNDARVVDGAFTLSDDALLLVSGASASFQANGDTAISNGRVSVTGGAMAAFPNATDYQWSLCEQRQLFQAVGENSVLDLSGVTSITVDAPDCMDVIQNILVSEGGYIDFSGLQQVAAAESQQVTLSWLNGGTIATPNVEALERVFLLLGENTMADLPALIALTDSTITANAGAMVAANALTAAERCVFSIAGFESAEFDLLASMEACVVFFSEAGTLTLPELAVIRNSNMNISDGTTLNLPKLTTLESTDGLVAFATVGTGAVSAPALTSVRNVSFVASLGSMLSLPSVQTYRWDLCEGGALFTTGTESTINFSGLRTINIANSSCTGLGYSIGATGGSNIDLSGLTTINAPLGQFVSFLASNPQTVVDLSSLRTFNPALVTFLENDGGRILRASGGGEGEGEGGGNGGCPAPVSARGAAASVFGDLALVVLALGVMGVARRR